MSDKFYTNVQMYGNDILLRGYEGGDRFITRQKFYPTLFVTSKKETEWETLYGEKVQAISPGTIKECREFIKKYEEVDNFNVYGNERFIFQFIADNYPGEIKFDTSKMKVITVDIEVESENGLPRSRVCCRGSSTHHCPGLQHQGDHHLGSDQAW